MKVNSDDTVSYDTAYTGVSSGIMSRKGWILNNNNSATLNYYCAYSQELTLQAHQTHTLGKFHCDYKGYLSNDNLVVLGGFYNSSNISITQINSLTFELYTTYTTDVQATSSTTDYCHIYYEIYGSNYSNNTFT